MAEMSLDELLSSSIKSAAEPAASKGVADAIRARVAAGDAGTAVAGSTAPGWGGGATRPAWFLPMVGAIGILAIVLGLLVGGMATGAFRADPVATPLPIPSTSHTPTPSATPTPTPTPTPTLTTDPEPPPPPRDQTPPSIAADKWNPELVYGTESTLSFCDRSSDVTVTAADETALASVTAATSLAGTQAVLVQSGGGAFVFRFSGSYPKGADVLVNVSFTATDASGNSAVLARAITLRGADQCFIVG